MEYCHDNCMGCEKYPKAKNRKQCPTYQTRAKYIRHDIYTMRKVNKEKMK